MGFTGRSGQGSSEAYRALSKELGLDIWLEAAKLPAACPSLKPWEICHKLEYQNLENTSGGAPDGEFMFSAQFRDFADNLEQRESNTATNSHNMEHGTNPSEVPESVLVRYSLYALQGVSSAVDKLENLSKAFCSQPADRSSHRVPSLWLRSTSTNALGKLLHVIAHAGRIRCQLGEFVDYFLETGSKVNVKVGDLRYNERDGGKGRRSRKHKRLNGYEENCTILNQEIVTEKPMASYPPFSLVNQAFAIALKCILQGYLAALNTLTASVTFRYLRKNDCELQVLPSHEAGCLTSVVSREITLLELYLHTGELRTHIQALGAICMLTNTKSCSELGCVEHKMDNKGFQGFPRGADLLTYLYNQLREADPIHHELLKFLFSRACRPYFDFIKSWLYRAVVKDPYNEFIVEASENVEPISNAGKRRANHLPVPSIKVRNGVSIPCFLKHVCTPLLRAGQQLQVLIRLLEITEIRAELPLFASSSMTGAASSRLSNLEAILDSRSYFLNEDASCEPVLVYSKSKLEDLMQKREEANRQMVEKLDNLFADLNDVCRQKEQTVVPVKYISEHVHKPADYGGITQQGKQLVVKGDHTEKGNYISASTPLDVRCREMNEEYSSKVLEEDFLREHETLAEDVDSCSSELCTDEEESASQEDWDSQSDSVPNVSPVVSMFQLKQIVSADREHKTPNGRSDIKRLSESEDKVSILPLIRKSKKGDHATGASSVYDEVGSRTLLSSGVACIDSESSSSSGLNLSEFATSRKHKSLISDYQRGTTWPQNGLPSNAFLSALMSESKYNGYTLPHFADSDHSWDMPLLKSFERAAIHRYPYISETFVKNTNMIHRSPLDFKALKLEKSNNLSDGGHSLDYESSCTLMGFHPMLTRSSWSHLQYLMPERSFRDREATLLRYYDFSALTDPSEIFGKSLPLKDFALDLSLSSEQHRCMAIGQSIHIKVMNHEKDGTVLADGHRPSSVGSTLRETQLAGEIVSKLGFEETTQTIMSPSNLSNNTVPVFHSEDNLAGASGGAKWETSLRYVNNDDIYNPERCEHNPEIASEIPLDVVVDMCIAQEILIQYRCISKFTVKLLEEGFGFQKHLLALRRYFFMEVADWADGFLMSLCEHKWSPTGIHQRLLEVQALLESALQRSSCEGDECEERLYIYIKVSGSVPQTEKWPSRLPNDPDTSSFVDTNSINAFDFIGLGYKVDWPLNMILTPDSFSMYTAIFSFLIQIKLAVLALCDIWNCLKELTNCVNRKRDLVHDKEEMDQLRILMQFRQQVSHFVGALQQYVQSQLLHVVWYKFLHLLKQQVEDMLDLESVHKVYLLDSLHICFLSSQMTPVRELICNIMQSVLDFRSCFHYKFQNFDEGEPFKLTNKINFSRVLEVKDSFEQNLKQLYKRYIKFGEQSEMTLGYFWMYLDYNEFISTTH